jgi:cobalt-zinc-cadmium efflux system outer membrane protein
VAAARAETAYQRALTVRQVGATFGTKRISGVNTMILGVSLPLPLFNQNGGEVQRATGERVAAERELEWTERQALAEVESAYEAARLLGEQVRRLQGKFLGRAEESRRIALAAYTEGAVSLLQVLDASRTLADARLTYYRTVFAQRQSLLELNVAVGSDPTDAPGGLKGEATVSPTTSLRTGGHQ